jgi:hypothetical protein
MHVSRKARALRDFLHSSRAGRFADDSVFGDRVVRAPHLSAFARSRKADNLFDCGRNPVQGTVAAMFRNIVSMELCP